MSSRRIVILLLCAVVAVAPAVLGLMGNQSFSREVAVRVPPQVSAVAATVPAHAPSPTAEPKSQEFDARAQAPAAAPEPTFADKRGLESGRPGVTSRGRNSAGDRGASSRSGGSGQREDRPRIATGGTPGRGGEVEQGDDHSVAVEPGDDSGGSSGKSGSSSPSSSGSGRHSSGTDDRRGADD